jgi:hypothetical protein
MEMRLLRSEEPTNIEHSLTVMHTCAKAPHYNSVEIATFKGKYAALQHAICHPY